MVGWSGYFRFTALARIAPVFGFSNYQPLIQHYVDEGLRIDMQRLNNPTLQKLTNSLKHHGVDESLIAKAVYIRMVGKRAMKSGLRLSLLPPVYPPYNA